MWATISIYHLKWSEAESTWVLRKNVRTRACVSECITNGFSNAQSLITHVCRHRTSAHINLFVIILMRWKSGYPNWKVEERENYERFERALRIKSTQSMVISMRAIIFAGVFVSCSTIWTNQIILPHRECSGLESSDNNQVKFRWFV